MKIVKPTTESTARALWVIGEDLAQLAETTRRIHLQVEALSARHGVSLPRTPYSPF